MSGGIKFTLGVMELSHFFPSVRREDVRESRSTNWRVCVCVTEESFLYPCKQISHALMFVLNGLTQLCGK